ncbi:hypothetical protein BKA70DRAFT_1308722 [Coprinopsis sp. MPI-PUGE-AT-0042]|nr:hypothetical protein BKA70DRAFT_1308722 [Coprinopsis sp. MPI-PUGE-AT-0042]
MRKPTPVVPSTLSPNPKAARFRKSLKARADGTRNSDCQADLDAQTHHEEEPVTIIKGHLLPVPDDEPPLRHRNSANGLYPTQTQPSALPAPVVSASGSASASSSLPNENNDFQDDWTIMPFKIGLSPSWLTNHDRPPQPAFDPRPSQLGEVQLVTYNPTLRKHTRLSIRPLFLIMLISTVLLSSLTFLSILSFVLTSLLSIFIAELLKGSPSFHYINSVVLTLLFIYSMCRQVLDWLRGLVQPRRRVPAGAVLINKSASGTGQDTPIHQSIWNEKDRPR